MVEISVLDSQMAYVEAGTGGVPVVFLHGNPTSSFLWRNVLPRVAPDARCLAPDLIGMGSSGHPEIAYRFADHARYLDAWFEAVGLAEFVLVGHDWGGSLDMDWAARHPDRVRGLVLIETFLRPMSWAEYPSAAVEFFRNLRTPGVGERMVLEENWFIEQSLPRAAISEADLDTYRTTYPDPESHRPCSSGLGRSRLTGNPRMCGTGCWRTGAGWPKAIRCRGGSGGGVGGEPGQRRGRAGGGG